MAKRERGAGKVFRKGASPFLYIKFRYLGRTIEQSTLTIKKSTEHLHHDTPENRVHWERWLDTQFFKIDAETFRYADAFPYASEKQKKRFADLEGEIYSPDMKKVTFAMVASGWAKDVLKNKPGERAKQLETRVKLHLIKPFGGKTFTKIKSYDVENLFYNELKHVDERKKSKFGTPISPKSKKDVLGAFRSIWAYGCHANNWVIADPSAKVVITRSKEKRKQAVHFSVVMDPDFLKNNPDWSKPEDEIVESRRVLRFEEWECISGNLGWALPVIKFQLLTGAIYSEVAGLQWLHIKQNKIEIQQSYHPKQEIITPIPKAKSRYRDFKITKAIRRVLDEVRGDEQPDPNSFVFRSPGDLVLDYETLENQWKRAVRAEALEPLSMYCLRHSFIAWCLVISLSIIRVVALAGHCTRKMVDENYGKYVESLEDDRKEIRIFFGKDFYPADTEKE